MDLSKERMEFIYELGRVLPTMEQIEPLVRFATEKTRELFAAEGAALILLDAKTNELYFPVVRDEQRFAQLRVARTRFPAHQGVAGWALANDRSALVTDAQNDPRFYAGIDRKSNMTTERLLCSPLRTSHGNIGVLEVVNPAERFTTQDDLDFLDLIARDVSAAYERAERLAEERQGGAVKKLIDWATAKITP